MIRSIVATLLVQAASPVAVAQDSADSLVRAARRAEARYESLARRLAPFSLAASSGGPCDEIVGRFCLRFQRGEEPPPKPEPGRVTRARREAVEALRLAFSARPGELAVAGALVRHLVEDGRSREALAAAETFAWASGDSIWGGLLTAFALHAAGDDTASERRYAQALARMPEAERARFTRPEVLLSPREREVYRDMDAAAQASYEEALWRAADPLYLTPGNEAWTEHLSRRVWSRLLERGPVVSGMVSWGRDLEQLTIRYGVPVSREREWGMSALDTRFVERFDPDQLAFVPEELSTAGAPPQPAPGAEWPLRNERARSGFVPVTVRRLRPVAHQASRFPVGDSVILRVDAALPLDSTARAPVGDASPSERVAESGLFVRDEAYAPVRTVRAAERFAGDTVHASHEVGLPPGRYVYSIEVLEEVSRLAGRGRFGVDLAMGEPGTARLSDILVVRPYRRGTLPAARNDPVLRPLADLVAAPDDTLGVYVEAYGLSRDAAGAAHYRVELTVEPEEERTLARAARWLGRVLGVVGPREEPRLSWDAAADGPDPVVIAVDVALTGLGSGLHTVRLAVRDRLGDRRTEASRLVRIAEPQR